MESNKCESKTIFNEKCRYKRSKQEKTITNKNENIKNKNEHSPIARKSVNFKYKKRGRKHKNTKENYNNL